MKDQEERREQISSQRPEPKQSHSGGDRLRELILLELSDALPSEAYMLHPPKTSE